MMQAPDRETDRGRHEPETAQQHKHLTWIAGAGNLHRLRKPSLAHDGDERLPTEAQRQCVEQGCDYNSEHQPQEACLRTGRGDESFIGIVRHKIRYCARVVLASVKRNDAQNLADLHPCPSLVKRLNNRKALYKGSRNE